MVTIRAKLPNNVQVEIEASAHEVGEILRALVSLYGSTGQSPAGIYTTALATPLMESSETKHRGVEEKWDDPRLRVLNEARARGRRIELSNGTIILYGDKVFFDRCWSSDVTIASMTMHVSELKDLIKHVRVLEDLDAARNAVKMWLEKARPTLRRLARSDKVVSCLAELVVKVHRGEVEL